MAHGVHPNFADRHDAQHKPRLNGGPVIKTNVNMRYATNAVTAARFREACQSENVPVQEFVNRSDLACGSTIGPISASALSIPTVDVGNAMLSMHSIREQSGAQDVDRMTRVMARILRDS
jgi:aspartyl aminopeptidase